MPTVFNITLIDTLQRGHILTTTQLDEVKNVLQQRLRDPRALLQELVRRGWLTMYQARQIANGRGADLLLNDSPGDVASSR